MCAEAVGVGEGAMYGGARFSGKGQRPLLLLDFDFAGTSQRDLVPIRWCRFRCRTLSCSINCMLRILVFSGWPSARRRASPTARAVGLQRCSQKLPDQTSKSISTELQISLGTYGYQNFEIRFNKDRRPLRIEEGDSPFNE